MAKKRKRTLRTSDAIEDLDDEEGEWEEDTAEEPVKQEAKPRPPTPKLMVTWNGAGESKIWNGITFKNGEPQAIDHSPWKDAMRQAIDAGGPEWKYEYVVEQS